MLMAASIAYHYEHDIVLKSLLEERENTEVLSLLCEYSSWWLYTHLARMASSSSTIGHTRIANALGEKWRSTTLTAWAFPLLAEPCKHRR